MDWVDGTRVRIEPHPMWPEGGTGTVRPVRVVFEGDDGIIEGCTRVVKGRHGPVTFVWVVFDRPMKDGDDDGPYREGEIEAEHLSPE
jgi:hypothetical protein